MTQYEKSAATLELPAILAMLAHHAVSDEAKARAAALSPSTDAATVQRLLAETSAARGMMVKRGSPSFSGVKDVRASLSRADMGGTLNIRELMDIAGVLTAARMARTYAAGDGRADDLQSYFRRGIAQHDERNECSLVLEGGKQGVVAAH